MVNVTSQVESISNDLYSLPVQSYENFASGGGSTCDSGETAQITVFTTNGIAEAEIDVRLDGAPIGTLTTYYPDDTPHCKAASGAGIISLIVPAGTHTIEAESSNINWPVHEFSVDKCTCMLLPLS